jgi:general stress protein 26
MGSDQMADTPTREQAIATFARMIDGIPVAMLTTTGFGRLRSRPMVAQREPFDGCIWFLTVRAAGKTAEIRDRQAVHVTFAAPAENRYVWASGTSSIVDDPARLKALWHGGYLQWLPGGPDDPSVTLIKVAVEEAEYWDEAAGRMVRLDSFIQPGSAFRDIVAGVGI